MKIHEYQAKSLLKKYNIPIQDGVTIDCLSEAEGAIKQVSEDYSTDQFVIKAQIHAGGRGKGGGVKFTPTKEDALDKINDILGMTLITHQTGPEGRLVKKVMVGEAIDIKKEYYVAIKHSVRLFCENISKTSNCSCGIRITRSLFCFCK